jgi:vacuolar iron transporter family protein
MVMQKHMQKVDLEAEHLPTAVRKRLATGRRPSYLGDAVLGGIDGCVTTFAVVAGAVGGGFAPMVVIVLGFANLLADGFSMAVSNYQSTRSQQEQIEVARRQEEQQIERIPEGEREEIRQIFAQKGFSGAVLETIVETITNDRQLWVDTMLTEELGLSIDTPDPLRASMATGLTFILVGLIPLLPFLLPLTQNKAFLSSIIATGIAFFSIGAAKGRTLQRPVLRAGLETLVTGGAAAALAYLVGAWLRSVYGVS